MINEPLGNKPDTLKELILMLIGTYAKLYFCVAWNLQIMWCL